MSEFQPPHQTGGTAEQCHHPDTSERKDLRPDLPCEVGALACGDACPYYRGELDGRKAPTQTERTERMSATTVTLTKERAEQIRTEIREGREFLHTLETYVIPGLRNRKSVKKGATFVSIPPIVPVIIDPNSPLKRR